MFAVVVRESGEQDQLDASGPHLEANVLPRVRQAPGFVSGVWMTDKAGRTLNVLVFETEDAARGALEMARNAPRPGFIRFESADLFAVRART
jgi:hypothetical protein